MSSVMNQKAVWARNDLRLTLGKLEREMARNVPREAMISELNAKIQRIKADIELASQGGDDEA